MWILTVRKEEKKTQMENHYLIGINFVINLSAINHVPKVDYVIEKHDNFNDRKDDHRQWWRTYTHTLFIRTI